MIPICTLCSRYKWVRWHLYLSSVHKKLLGASFLLRSNPLGMSPECLEVEVRPNCNLCLSSFTLLPRHDALKLGKGFAKETNCSVSNLVCLLSLAPEAVLAAQIKTSRVLQTPAHAHQIQSYTCGHCPHSYIIGEHVGCFSVKQVRHLFFSPLEEISEHRNPKTERLQGP